MSTCDLSKLKKIFISNRYFVHKRVELIVIHIMMFFQNMFIISTLTAHFIFMHSKTHNKLVSEPHAQQKTPKLTKRIFNFQAERYQDIIDHELFIYTHYNLWDPTSFLLLCTAVLHVSES